jgi:hypothetical protein
MESPGVRAASYYNETGCADFPRQEARMKIEILYCGE